MLSRLFSYADVGDKTQQHAKNIWGTHFMFNAEFSITQSQSHVVIMDTGKTLNTSVCLFVPTEQFLFYFLCNTYI